MQNVDFRNGTLRFRLPKPWIAEYTKDGGASFREPEGIGVLFLHTIDFDTHEPATPDHAVDLLANYGDHEGREVLQLTNGSVIVTYVEQRDDLAAFAWEVAHALPPDHLRLAAFSFTVKAEASNDPKVVQVVSMLTREIALAEFGPA